MKTYRLVRRQVLPTDQESAWRFFADPSNLRLITPPWLDFKITSPVPRKMYAGMIITYNIRPLAGIAIPWVSEITQVNAPHFFVDEQRHGPYRFWHHQHHLQMVQGGVEKTDEIHYRLPWGLFGIAIHAISVRRKLVVIFDYRHQALGQIFGSHA